jgi:hypothetical protein
VLAGLVVFLAFCAGRKTFGPVLDWVFPPNARIEGLLRWVAMLDVFVALCAGLGGAGLVRALERVPFLARRAGLALALVTALVLGLALPRHAHLLAEGLTTFPEEHDRPAFGRIAAEIASDPAHGRVYTREALGHSSHWAMAYLTLLTGKPMTISYAVGGQDSLCFYYLWYFDVLDARRAPALLRLFDIRYLLTRPGQDLGALPASLVAREGPYEVSRLAGDYGLFEWIDAPRVLEAATPAEARPACLRWMMEEYPRGASFLRLAEPIRARLPHLPSSNRAEGERKNAARPAPARAVRGRVLAEEEGLSRYSARVQLDEPSAWLLLKVTAHPYWEARVDGRVQPIHYLSPAYMGLELGAGEHEVEFTFRAPGWQKALLAFALLFALGLVAFDLRRGRAARAAESSSSAVS